MTISKTAGLACIVLAMGLPPLASAGDIALRLNQDARSMSLSDDSVSQTPAITYRIEPVAVGAGQTENQYVAEVQTDGFLICNEFASEGNTANTNLHIRPVHDGWIIGSYDAESPMMSSTTPGDAISVYLQGSFARVNKLAYHTGVLDVTACDGLGNGTGCVGSEPWQSGGAALQCYTADSSGHGVADSGSLFASGFDDYTPAGNSYVKILNVSPPQGGQDTYDYTVQWSIPVASAPQGRYVLQLGYDQAVFGKCGTQSGSTIQTKLRDEPTASGILQMHCQLTNPNDPPPTGSAPVVVAALFTDPNARETEYTDNVAFAGMTGSAATATLQVNVFDQGSVTAATPPNPVYGDIYECTSSGGSNCTAAYLLGANVNLEANPAVGHYFVSWNGACSGTNPSFSLQLNADKSCGALFAANLYTLNYAAGDYGELVGDVQQSVAHGADGTPVEAVPDLHYQFIKWIPDNSTENPRQDLAVTGNINVTAQFGPETFIVTGQSNGNGTVTPVMQEVAYEDFTVLLANPSQGYRVGSGTGCGGSFDGNTYYTGPITADCTVVVDFVPENSIGNITSASGGNDSVASPSQMMARGDDTDSTAKLSDS